MKFSFKLFSEEEIQEAAEIASELYASPAVVVLPMNYFRANISLNEAKKHLATIASNNGVIPLRYRFNDDLLEVVAYCPHRPSIR